ncbi:hypothetical protein [Winogradskyella sp. 3972H.M.0a.05]|uniref:virginiamycin B lyase family protein n=1 Tax=Winogradskyella sp. 3972H.M.0a.05 TaxID=2950277 RepID=UPI003391AE77
MKNNILIVLFLIFACGGSDDSTMVTPPSPLNAVSSIIATDIANNGDASDINVIFTASTQEGLLAYRAIVLKSAASITLSEALDLPNDAFFQFSAGVNEVTLPSSLRDTDGDTIEEETNYKVAIISIHDSDESLSALSSFSNVFSLIDPSSQPLQPVSSISIVDNTNNGNASDIDTSFQPAAFSAQLSMYRIYVVKNANTLDLATALTVISGRYAELASALSQAVLPSDLKDVDGDDIIEGEIYKLFVLSVHEEDETLSALSNPSSSFTIERTNLVSTLVQTINIGTGGVSVDQAGNVYVADFGVSLPLHNGTQVARVTPNGDVSTFISGFADGASGNHFDAQGNFYQSHQGGNRISVTDTNGVTTNFSSGGFLSVPIGIAIDAQGNLFVANCGGNNIIRITPQGNQSVFASSGLLSCPNGITFDASGNLFVANFNNGSVIRVDSNGNASTFSTIPGNNNGHIIYANDRLYVIARSANSVYEIDMNGNATLLAGNGTRGGTNGAALNSNLSLPNDLDVSPDGTKLYVNEVATNVGNGLTPSRVRVIHLDAEN